MSLYRWFVGGTSSWTDRGRQRRWDEKDRQKARKISTRTQLRSARKARSKNSLIHW